MPRRTLAAVGATVALAALLTACAETDPTGAGVGTAVAVDSGDDTCVLSATTIPAGDVTFTVTNSGSDVTELYVYAEDGTTIVGEVEDVTPGLARDLDVSLAAGSYVAACKPGMVGDGIRTSFQVTSE